MEGKDKIRRYIQWLDDEREEEEKGRWLEERIGIEIKKRKREEKEEKVQGSSRLSLFQSKRLGYSLSLSL